MLLELLHAEGKPLKLVSEDSFGIRLMRVEIGVRLMAGYYLAMFNLVEVCKLFTFKIYNIFDTTKYNWIRKKFSSIKLDLLDFFPQGYENWNLCHSARKKAHFVNHSFWATYSNICEKMWKLKILRFGFISMEKPSSFQRCLPNLSAGLCFWSTNGNMRPILFLFPLNLIL